MTSGLLFQLLAYFALKNATVRTHTLKRTHILYNVWGDFPFAHIWWHKLWRLSFNNFTFLHFSMMIGGSSTAESDTLCRELHTCMYVLVTSTLWGPKMYFPQTEWGLFPPLPHLTCECRPSSNSSSRLRGAWIIWLLTPVSLLPAGGRSLIVQKGLRHI